MTSSRNKTSKVSEANQIKIGVTHNARLYDTYNHANDEEIFFAANENALIVINLFHHKPGKS